MKKNQTICDKNRNDILRGKFVKILCKYKITISFVSRMTGVSREHLSRWINNETDVKDNILDKIEIIINHIELTEQEIRQVNK